MKSKRYRKAFELWLNDDRDDNMNSGIDSRMKTQLEVNKTSYAKEFEVWRRDNLQHRHSTIIEVERAKMMAATRSFGKNSSTTKSHSWKTSSTNRTSVRIYSPPERLEQGQRLSVASSQKFADYALVRQKLWRVDREISHFSCRKRSVSRLLRRKGIDHVDQNSGCQAKRYTLVKE